MGLGRSQNILTFSNNQFRYTQSWTFQVAIVNDGPYKLFELTLILILHEIHLS